MSLKTSTHQQIEQAEEIRLEALANEDYATASKAVERQIELLDQLIALVDAQNAEIELALLTGRVPKIHLPQN